MKKVLKLKIVVVVILFLGYSLNAQTVERVEPPFWWSGMKNTSLQLLIYGENISSLSPKIENTAVQITKVHQAKSPNYLFVDLDISYAKAGKFEILFLKGKKRKLTYHYELKARKKNTESKLGFGSSDAIYLITPDRFANANPKNDIVKGLKENKIDRNDDYARHGGDIHGITNHLDYIDDLGFTAIWSCPLLTNDMKSQSYHGYAITDYYQIDPRFGTLEDYIALSEKASKKGIKLIMDQVANHCGLEHWWMKDLPFSDWVNFQKDFEAGKPTTYSNHKRTTNQDFYASNIDKKRMSDGWFVDSMPDLNQRNPFLATYIIQNSIWWIELANLGGIRQDTYPYPDKNFMAKWAGAIMQEYPNFSIVGEEWSTNPLLVNYWQAGANNKDSYQSHLTSTMDFPMQKNIVDALKEEESWGSGLVKMYEGLANDFAYANPEKIMIFPDNHDMSRIYTQLNEDVALTQMALAYLLTLPRIPQIYYGTEILMNDTAKPGDHGLIRSDFPGGWQGDKVNAFTGDGLNSQQKEMQWFVKTLLQYRKNSKAIHQGKTKHFAPNNGIYVLSRTFENEQVILFLVKKPQILDMEYYQELNLDTVPYKNILTGKKLQFSQNFNFDKVGVYLFTSKL